MNAIEVEQVNRGRLFALKLKHNHASRTNALQSIRQLPNGKWRARIGGRVRGKFYQFPGYLQAEKAVNDHYNDQLMKFLGKGSHGSQSASA